jgi:hypothetical protein
MSRSVAEGVEALLSKIIAIIALVILPLNLTYWYRSHSHPVRYRFDLTLYKSLDVYLRNGVCSLHLLSMPTRTASKSEFETSLHHQFAPTQASFFLSSRQQGALRFTWVIFPFWLASLMLTGLGALPIVGGPVLRWWRQRRGRCLFCGYDLTGNRSGRCSECGGPARP